MRGRIFRRLLAAIGLSSPHIELLSKADAIRLFGLTKEQWLQEVQRTVASGAAVRAPGDSNIVGMSTRTAEGDLLTVRVDYSKVDNRPDFIQVVIGYEPQRAALFTDQSLAQMIGEVKSQMAPECVVIAHADRIGGGLGVLFTIMRSWTAVGNSKAR